MVENLLDLISSTYHDTVLTDKWANGLFGEIVDIKGDGNYRFVDYGMDADGKPYKVHLTKEDEMACPVVATGFVAYWLHNRNQRVKDIFEGYFTQQLQAYERAHEYDDDAWKRDLKREFVERKHLSAEHKAIRTSEAIFRYLTKSDKKRIESITTNYRRFVRKKRKELYPPDYPKGRELQETFLAPFRSGGAAAECVELMRLTHKLPRFKPQNWVMTEVSFQQRVEIELLYADMYERVVDEYIDIKENGLSYDNSIVTKEIHETLKACATHDDRFRYITSLVQSFQGFAEVFNPQSMIDDNKRIIENLEKRRKRCEEMADDVVDKHTGETLDKQQQIKDYDCQIQKYKEDIEYLTVVQQRFFIFTQPNLRQKYAKNADCVMCGILGFWWRQMIVFAQHLAALALTYGIKLSDVQQQCGVYLIQRFVSVFYVDDRYVTSHEQALRLLHEIASKQAKTDKENSVKPNTEAEPDQRITTEEATPQPEQSQTRKTQTKSSKQSKKEGKQANKPLVYYTLKYINQNPTRYTRIDFVHRKLEEWRWMVETTSIESYEQLFSGTHADCQLKWAGDAPTLYKLMQELLKQPFIERYKGCSARSIVLSQFSDKFNQHTERVSNDDLQKIKYIIYLLNPKSNIPMTGRRGNETLDISDEALAEAMLYSGELSNSSHA
ncbi:hypothetical protein JQM83_03050 [Parabacteroides distasonis]|nr:hypothetical protein [Parabacteroides distasonis]